MFPDEIFKNQLKPSSNKNESNIQQSESYNKSQHNKSYIRQNLLNNSFKILFIDIISIKQIQSYFNKFDSYISYTIKIITQDFTYEVDRRYSQFLSLYQNIIRYQLRKKNFQSHKQIKSIYFFPSKNISFSFLKIFNITNILQIAGGRKPYLSSFLNQINNNYSKSPNQFAQHYIELLQFINMKQQHSKFYIKKNPALLKSPHHDIALPIQNKQLDKTTNTTQSVNIEYLSQLLQHQITKINLAIATKYTNKQNDQNNDPLIVDQIIKNVDTIKDIVIQMKRKINFDHIRCIMKGKDINQGKKIPSCSLSVSKPKVGLIQFSLKHAKNELVAIHTIKTILTVLLNSQCNYSSQLFQKILLQFEARDLVLNDQQLNLSRMNKQYRELYFKLIKLYIELKQELVNKKNGCKSIKIGEIINEQLIEIYQKWEEKEEKNKLYKFKDDKQWMMIIQNINKNQEDKNNNVYQIKNNNQIQQTSKFIDEQNTYNQQQNDNNMLQKNIKNIQLLQYNNKNIYQKKYKQRNLQIYLNNQKNQYYSKYIIKIFINNIFYHHCIEFLKNQKNWNPLLIDTQYDLYSNTRKQRYRIPGKQQKIFRFIEGEDIQMNLEDHELDHQINVKYQSHFHHQEDANQCHQQNNKMSMQTTQSLTTCCTDQQHSQTLPFPCPQLSSSIPVQPLSCTQLSQKITFIKSPPSEGKFNSFTQRIKIQKIKPLTNLGTPCLIQIQMYFTQPASIKYFNSQIQCTTTYIWDGIINLFSNLLESTRNN